MKKTIRLGLADIAPPLKEFNGIHERDTTAHWNRDAAEIRCACGVISWHYRGERWRCPSDK